MAKYTRKNPLKFRIKKGTKDIRCPKCKQQCFIDGSGTYELPTGFGYKGGKYAGKFVVDKVQWKGWVGECPKHGVILAYHTKKMVTKVPRGINAKIKAAEKKRRG